MTWWRAWRKEGGGLALVALALQLALAFGHVHAPESAGAQPSAAVESPAGDGFPQHPDSDPADCAICAVTHLTGTALVPVCPALSMPIASSGDLVACADRRAASRHAVRAFRARAPPQA